ncbi:MAG: hypothetical protein E6R03_10740 [Hyphomicrobiaceae bacterium]|nr:MAG: hypothetical protein E6R03_10740 [Hyphomicrobiaceae bacterium]
MTTVYQIIVDAYRVCNLIPVGVAPTQQQEAEGLRYLDRIIKSVLGYEVGEQTETKNLGDLGVGYSSVFGEWDNSSTVLVPGNTKVMCNLTSSQEIWLDPNPSMGARLAIQDIPGNFATYNLTVHGNGRRIEGQSSIILITDSTNTEWLYDNEQGDWLKIANLTKFDNLPFPSKFDDFFIISLAYRLNPAYSRQFDPQTDKMLRRAERQLSSTYRTVKEKDTELALLKLSGSNNLFGIL